MPQKEIKQEMDSVIREFERQGIQYNSHKMEKVGLGDAVEGVLTSMGITQERFKEWFNLKECNCNERKKWLNNLFSWKRSKD